jgi:ABC-type branched-subunit amino acid transport system substrate-binding protein
MDTRQLPVQTRARSVVLLLGVVMGLLIAGLAVPFAFGKRLSAEGAGFAGGSDVLIDESELLGGEVPGEVPGEMPGEDPFAPEGEPLDPGATGSDPADPGMGAPGQPGADAGGAPAAPGAPAGPQNGGSGGAGTAPKPGTAPGTPQGQPLTATDRGVTADAVKAGFTLLDVGGAGRVGIDIGISAEQQQAAWQAYVDDINARGGLNARKVVPSYTRYDPLSEDSQRRACVSLTQDAKVFAVVGGFNFPSAVSCVTRENQTPLFSGYASTSDELFRQAEGRFVTLYPAASRMMALTVDALARAGRLKGRTIGILNQQQNDPGGKTSATLEATLKARGFAVKRRADLSSDSGTSASQVPVEVNQFRSEGIDTVFFLAGPVTSTQFVQQAESQGYRPAYHTTDWASMSNDVSTQNMPATFDGTIGTTSYLGYANKMPPFPETQPASRCREIYNARSGRKLAKIGTAEYAVTMQACDSISVFERTAKAAGAKLTRASVAPAVQKLGSFPLSIYGPGAYRSGKLDYAETIRFQVWRSSCSCWQRQTDFFRP